MADQTMHCPYRFVSRVLAAALMMGLCFVMFASANATKHSVGTARIPEQEMKSRVGGQTSSDARCVLKVCRSSQNLICDSGISDCDNTIKDKCQIIGGITIVDQKTYQNPESCLQIYETSKSCFTGQTVSALCYVKLPCRCIFVPLVWRCKIPAGSIPTNVCQNIDVGQGYACSYQTCP